MDGGARRKSDGGDWRTRKCDVEVAGEAVRGKS